MSIEMMLALSRALPTPPQPPCAGCGAAVTDATVRSCHCHVPEPVAVAGYAVSIRPGFCVACFRGMRHEPIHWGDVTFYYVHPEE